MLKFLLLDLQGMTETSCVATRFPYPETDTTGSIGKPIPNVDLKLVDDDGKDVSEYDLRGEICIRGPTVVKGYFENPEANARDWDEDGFFHTGDIGYVDGKTKLWYIVDRKKVRPSNPYKTASMSLTKIYRSSSKCVLSKWRLQSSKAPC